MNLLTFQPKLGHITTFGGHPISCAASLALLKYLLDSNIINDIYKKEMIFREYLSHQKIIEIRGKGLMLAIEFGDKILAKKLVEESLKKGLILFYFLFNDTSVRITPPLNISKEEIIKGCKIITSILNQ